MSQINLEQVLSYGGHSLTVGDIGEAGLAYLLQYGYSQSLQDSIAGLAKKVKGDADKFAKALTIDTPAEGDEDGLSALVEMVEDDKLADRSAKIAAGTIGLPTGVPRLAGDAKLANGIAREWLRRAAAEAKVKLPAVDSDEYTTFVSAMYEQNKAAIDAEVLARKTRNVDIALPAGLVKA